MKLAYLLVIYILSCHWSLGQVQQQYIQDPSQYGKALEANTEIDIQGSPYFLEGWSPGLASLSSEASKFKFSKMRYNALTGQVEFDNKGKVMYLDPKIFSQFILIRGLDSLIFKNQIEGVKTLSATAYVWIPFQGINLWLIKPVKSLINDPEAPYGSTKRKIIETDQIFYVVKSDREVITFKMTSHSISRNLSIQKKMLSDFLMEMELSLENAAHYKKIFQWLDNQI